MVDGVFSAKSCADIIRPSQTYTPADPTLTIGTILTLSYQECGQLCRVTTLCRTAAWCQGQCTMYQEYVIFGTRAPDLNCMLITLSGIAYNEVEPAVSIARNIIYEESQSKYYEQTYAINSLDECIQLCRLDSHCLTASYQTSTGYCCLFAEHASQGRNHTNFDWTTIVLDTCMGRDAREYPCLIDATNADKTLCELLSQTQPIRINWNEMKTSRGGYTGWLTKLFIYLPIGGSVVRDTYDANSFESIFADYELRKIIGDNLHVSVDQRAQVPTFYVDSKSMMGNKIYRIHLKNQATMGDFLSNITVSRGCRWCYFASDGPNVIYVAMDEGNSIERYENNGQSILSIYIPSPSGILIRNHNLWIVNASQLIKLEPRQLPDRTLTYNIANQIDLSLLYQLPITRPFTSSSYSIFTPFHLDVDNYGRVYISGALLDLWLGASRHSPGNNRQLYVLTGAEQGTPSVLCAGPWGMFGVNVYHSKLKIRMLTSTDEHVFNLYSSP